MPELLRCPSCKANLEIVDETRSTIKCEYCGSTVAVPVHLRARPEPQSIIGPQITSITITDRETTHAAGCWIWMAVLGVIGLALFIVVAAVLTSGQSILSIVGERVSAEATVTAVRATASAAEQAAFAALEATDRPLPTPTPAFAEPALVVGERGTGRGQFENPRRLAVDNVGYVYVYDSDSRRMQVFDESGDYQTQWPFDGTVLSMLADRDRRLYVLGTELIRYDGSTGREIDRISVTTPVGPVSRFEAMALTPQGNLVLSFWDRNGWIDYLLLADDSGQLIEAWEGAVTTPYGKDGVAKLIAVDRQGTIYAYELETILKFGPDGRFTNRVGARGSGPGEWSAPRNIAVDQSGRLYVGEGLGIHVYDTNARFLDTIPTDSYVMDLAISDNNDIWAIVGEQLVRFELLNR